jgi:hypothetical protein
MNHSDFVHKNFRANEWELEVKTYIDNLPVRSNLIWYKEARDLKKASEELITLGYYVKYKFGIVDSIQFCLNLSQDAVDGWIFQEGKQIESVQIVIAYYEEEEAKQDELTMSGKECCPGGWEIDRLEVLKTRVEQRIRKKVEKKYTKIDTLIVAVKGCFVRSVLEEYSNLKGQLERTAKALLAGSQFKELAIVDADLVGKGEVWLFPLCQYK